MLKCIMILFPCVGLLAGEPKIAVNGKTLINLGSFPANEQRVGTFKLANTGDAELKIKKIHKTCGCSVNKLDKKEIKPGETAVLTAGVKPESIGGPFSKAIYVESNDPKKRLLRLMISGHAIPLLKVLPKNYLYMGTLKVSKETDYSFILEPTRKGVRISAKVKKTNIPLSVKIVPEAKNFRLNVHVSPDKKIAIASAEIEVSIDAPKNWKPIFIKLRGQVIE